MSKTDNRISFFKPQDFTLTYIGHLDSIDKTELADAANAKLEKETLDVASAIAQCAMTYFDIYLQDHQKQGFTQYLASRFILLSKPPPCTHPKEKVLRYDQYCLQGLKTGPKENAFIGTGYQCECGKTVTPSGFEE